MKVVVDLHSHPSGFQSALPSFRSSHLPGYPAPVRLSSAFCFDNGHPDKIVTLRRPPSSNPTNDRSPSWTLQPLPHPGSAITTGLVGNSSVGKDSQAMLDVVAQQAKDDCVLGLLVVVHADLGRDS